MVAILSRRAWAVAVAVTVVAAIASLGVAGPGRRDADARDPAHALAGVSISGAVVGRAIPAGFLGVSLEYPAVTDYAGTNPAAINPLLVNLIAALAPGQRPVIRIGGDSSDTTWWPLPGLPRPGGVSYSLSPRWLAVVRALTGSLRARLILGVDLEAGSTRLAAAEARALLDGIGGGSVQAIEIGNEAPRYKQFPWYHRDGEPVFARGAAYDYSSFSQEFAAVDRLLPRGARAAGPTFGGSAWMGNLTRFVASEPRLGLITYHHYPTNRCFTAPGSPDFPTVPGLLSVAASRGVDPGLASYVRTARRRHLPVRLDETNSVACGGKQGVSDTFAAALWALDSLFGFTRTGIVGVNFHTFPGARYALFGFRHRAGRWSAWVAPEYYGLEMFAQAAPPGARLLRLTSAAGPGLRVWATRAPDGTVHVVMINDDLSQARSLRVRVPAGLVAARLTRLTAPSAYAQRGVRLESAGVASAGRSYVIRMSPSSAAMLTLAQGSRSSPSGLER